MNEKTGKILAWGFAFPFAVVVALGFVAAIVPESDSPGEAVVDPPVTRSGSPAQGAFVTPTPTPAPVPSSASPSPAFVPPVTEAVPSYDEPEVYYANCAEVWAAGKAPIHQGQPGYANRLDRDGDGTGCDR